MAWRDRLPILLWAWVVGYTMGLRGLAKRIAAEREISRKGVRIVYLSFNERGFNLRMDMWGLACAVSTPARWGRLGGFCYGSSGCGSTEGLALPC